MYIQSISNFWFITGICYNQNQDEQPDQSNSIGG